MNIFYFNATHSFPQALVKKSTDLTPATQDQTAVLNLVTKLQAVLDAIVVTPGTFDACVSYTNFYFV
jgi:hypothetical protein